MRDLLKRNSGLLQLIPIPQLIDPTCSTLEMSLGKAPELSVSAFAVFNFAPPTTVDVESHSRCIRAFFVLTGPITEENLEKILFVMVNNVHCIDKGL